MFVPALTGCFESARLNQTAGGGRAAFLGVWLPIDQTADPSATPDFLLKLVALANFVRLKFAVNGC
jgi:hypothetical protein